MGKHYIGIDIGGTTIKGGIFDESLNLIYKTAVDTEAHLGVLQLDKNTVKIIEMLISEINADRKDIIGVGIGIPGIINGEIGEISYAANLNANRHPIVKNLSKMIEFPVKIANDANAACLGEVKFDNKKGCKEAIMITLGTGVGGGVVCNGELLVGNKGAGVELGHVLLESNGKLCTCGRRGCVEAYVSATALIRDTKEAMKNNPQSKLWEGVKTLDDVDAKLPFDFKDKDETAKKLVDDYIYYLGEALVNFGNAFRPEEIILGGGVANQGEALTNILQEYVDENIFAAKVSPRVIIRPAKLKNDAGIYGAAALFLE